MVRVAIVEDEAASAQQLAELPGVRLAGRGLGRLLARVRSAINTEIAITS